jgi:molecular chaperone DnaK (HSP70)
MTMPYTDEQGLFKKRLGIDFGMNNTVIAVYNGDNEEISAMEFPGVSRQFPSDRENTRVPVIPSLIHYTNNGSIIIGEQVYSQKCSDSPATARWMKQYICQNSPAQIPAGGERMIGFCQAATDFLMILLSCASGNNHKEKHIIGESVFTFPVEAPQWYTSWLEEVALSAGLSSYCLIDEAHAAALGYGLNPQPGCKVLIIDFGQEGLDVKVVAIGESAQNPAISRSRILGRASDNFGGLAIDTCILQDLRARYILNVSDATMRRVHSAMLRAITRMKEQLCGDEEASYHITNPVSGTEITGCVGRSDLDRIFDEQGIFAMLDRTLDRALAAAQMRGCEKDQITAVLMIGECSALPALKCAVTRKFVEQPVLHDHPVDAVARGAAMFTSLSMQTDRIRNNYALRYWDPASNEHRYRFLVRNGARYPSAGQIARIIISASYDSQTQMGIPVYEISCDEGDAHQCTLELISDSGGGMRIAGPAQDADAAKKPVRVNEQTPVILVASPPAQKGEPRFELTFTIDGRRNLCVTARDIITGKLMKTDAPLFRMT